MSGHRSPLPQAAATRRTAVGLLVAGLATVAGCDTGRSGDEAGPGVSGATDPDVALVDRVTAEIADLAALVASVAAAQPRLAAAMHPLHEMHLTHLRALEADPPAASSGRGFAGPDAALHAVRAAEQRCQSRLVDASVAARSGDLARVLASMSAGVAQRLTLLTAPPGGTAR